MSDLVMRLRDLDVNDPDDVLNEAADEIELMQKASAIVGRMATQQMELRQRAEAERDALRALLAELRATLSPTYRLSPEGRAYIERIDAALREGK